MSRIQILRRILNSLLVLVLLVISPGLTGQAVAQPVVYSYANGIQFLAAVPLPVFQVVTQGVNPETTQILASFFDRISNQTPPQTDEYLKHERLTILNEKNKTLLEQYSATGGFYAYDPSRAFGGTLVEGTSLDPGNAQRLACQFLNIHKSGLVPASNDLVIPGLSVLCDYDFNGKPLYRVSTEFLTTQSNQPGDTSAVSADMPLRMMVNVPIQLLAGNYSQGAPIIKLGGPGGHISMIFDDTTFSPNTPGPTLDSAITGLQAVAMPAFGRSFKFVRNIPAVDPVKAQGQILERVRAAYPDATKIQIPTPSLEYFVSDAAQPQGMMEPDLTFSGITLMDNGEPITLRDITVPGVESGPEGLGPTVTILAPTNGSFFFPGQPVTLQGSVGDGKPPFSYEWQLDDGTLLAGGPLDVAGALPKHEATLPVPDSKGAVGVQPLHLVVTDNDGVTREAVVSLNTPLSIFLPAINKGSPLTGILAPTSPKPTGLAPNTINYRFGVEYGSDYPPYGPGGPDLGGVPPDANGLSSGLLGLGWPRVFNWANASAWERDWRDCSLGGSDCTYGIDRADFVYYAGHGSNGGIAVSSNTHDSSWFDGSNARFQNAHWVGFASCLTLRAQWATPDAPIRRWFGAFQGAHMLMGFNSLMADVAFGPRLVDNMRLPTFLGFEMPWAQRTIAEAWVQTAFQLNAGKPAYIYATGSNGVNPSGNKLPKVTDPPMPRPYPANWYYWVWWNE